MDLVIFTSSKKCIVLNNWLLLEKITASRPGCRSKMGFYWCFLKVGCLPRCKKPRMHAGNLASKKKNMSGTKNWRNPVEAVGFPAYGYRKSPNPQFTGEQKVLSYLHFRYRTNPLVIRNFVQLHNDLLSAAGVLSTKEIVLEWHFGNFSRLAPQSIYIYASPPPRPIFWLLADVHVSEHCFPCWCGRVTGIQKISCHCRLLVLCYLISCLYFTERMCQSCFAFAWISLFLTYFSFRKSSVFKEIFSYMYQLNFSK